MTYQKNKKKGKLKKKKTLEGGRSISIAVLWQDCYLILLLLLVAKSPEVKVWQLKNISNIQLKFCIGLNVLFYLSF